MNLIYPATAVIRNLHQRPTTVMASSLGLNDP